MGLAAALGMGVSQASSSLSAFPEWVTTIFGKSPVVIATLVAIFLNVTLPREKGRVERDASKFYSITNSTLTWASTLTSPGITAISIAAAAVSATALFAPL